MKQHIGKDRFIEVCNEKNNGEGYLYIVECNKDTEKFFKIGITSSENLKDRLHSLPYNNELVISYKSNANIIYDLERKLKTIGDKYKPFIEFGGDSECFLDIQLHLDFLNTLDWLTSLEVHYEDGIKCNKRKASFTLLAKDYCKYMDEFELCENENRKLELDTIINDIIIQSDNLMKYHKVLTQGNIKTACFNMKKLDEMYDNIVLLKKLKNNPLNLVEENVYSVIELKIKLFRLYNNYSISKDPNTKDLKHWYDTKTTTKKVNGYLSSALKIVKIK